MCVCVCAHPIEFKRHISLLFIYFLLRKFLQFLRNQPNNNDDEHTKNYHFILLVKVMGGNTKAVANYSGEI